MKEPQSLPFERNRYYYGKMLTSTDFKAEQEYMNQKRMFQNKMTLGSGVICGLNVISLDQHSVLVESGVALDALGREIIVEKSTVKRLSALQGYKECISDRLCLCLRYAEEDTQPVYAVNRQEDQNEYENNRIREGYELLLADAQSMVPYWGHDSDFFVKTTLVENEIYCVYLCAPAKACKGKQLKVTLGVIWFKESDEPLTLSYCLQLAGLEAMDGTRELFIEKNAECPIQGNSVSYEYWVHVPESELTETTILARGENQTEGALKIALLDMEPDVLVTCEIGRTSLEGKDSMKVSDSVRLAELHMIHTETDFLIDRIEENQVKEYIPLPANETRKSIYRACYGDSNPEEIQSPQNTVSGQNEDATMEVHFDRPQIASGIIEIPLEEHTKKDAVCFSEEIIHGLGTGSVYVALGVDKPDDGVNRKKRIRSTIYGDMSLFAQKDSTMTQVRTAVKVWEDKGSFQAGVQLAGEQNTVLLMLHWTAIKLPEKTDGGVQEQIEPTRITPETATIRLVPGEQYHFDIRFHNMKPCPLCYELMEADSGQIEEDGTYTAPKKAGVYELKISCAGQPDIFTYAYAVVNGKGRDIPEYE